MSQKHPETMKKTLSLAQQFREAFSFPTKDVTHFYPGHMSRGMFKMQRLMKEVDCVIEVHDARVPLSGRNLNFSKTISVRPHLLVLNKLDLADPSYFHRTENLLRENYGIQHFMYSNCKQDRHWTVQKTLMKHMTEILTGSPRYHREGLDEYNVLVIGIPNVGKSSMINALRRTHIKKGKATPVGPHAGVTRSVMEKVRICDNPRVFLYDSPGITMPEVTDMDVAMKLALCATLKDHLIGEDIIADYMLYWLNKHEHFSYVDYFDLPGPTDNVLELLSYIAEQNNAVMKRRSPLGGYIYQPDINYAAKLVLKTFREGKLGRYNLDQDHFEDSKS